MEGLMDGGYLRITKCFHTVLREVFEWAVVKSS